MINLTSTPLLAQQEIIVSSHGNVGRWRGKLKWIQKVFKIEIIQRVKGIKENADDKLYCEY